MNILIIDANSFVGENFCSQLENIANKKARWYKVNPGFTVWKCEQGIKEGELDLYCEQADFVFILTGLVTIAVPSVVSIVFSFLTLAALLIFKGREFMEEMEKALHV